MYVFKRIPLLIRYRKSLYPITFKVVLIFQLLFAHPHQYGSELDINLCQLAFYFSKGHRIPNMPFPIQIKAEKQKENKVGRGEGPRRKQQYQSMVHFSLLPKHQGIWWDQYYHSQLSFVGGSKAKGYLWSKRKENCMKHQEACDFNDQRPTFDYSYTNKGTKLFL